MSATLVDPKLREDPEYAEDRKENLPRVLRDMTLEQKEEFRHLVEKKAWIKASSVDPLTDEEQTKVAELQKDKGKKVADEARKRLYYRHHWNSLRWFLYGGLVDLPIQQDPKRAWDPETNPWIKVRVRSFVWTKDEHDEVQPYKRLPDKDYLRLLSYSWIHEPLLAIPKSRQMLVTWLFCAIACHETVCREAKSIAWISKKFDDADAHIKKRIKGISDRLPRVRYDVPETRHISGYFSCEETDSDIRAMGEEAKGLRQYTFSWVFDDEAAFQEQAGDIVEAGLATVKGGGRFTTVSSANGKEVFYGIVSESGRIAVPPGP